MKKQIAKQQPRQTRKHPQKDKAKKIAKPEPAKK
jgi:hypothetical protein